MRRTVRALSVAVLASAALGAGAGVAPAVPPTPAGGEAVAEAGPGRVAPDGTVAVPEDCDTAGGTPPEIPDTESQDFGEGAVEPREVPGVGEGAVEPREVPGVGEGAVEPREVPGVGEGTGEAEGEGAGEAGASAAAHRGTARIAAADTSEAPSDAVGPDPARTAEGSCPEASGDEGEPWSAPLTAPQEDGEAEPCAERAPAAGPLPAPHGESCGTEPACRGSVKPGESCGDEPTCSESGGHKGESCGTEPECAERGGHGAESCRDAVVPGGVHAGAGGAFTDSVPALVAGGLLIAGAFGAAVHRLRGRGGAEDR
ncbi:hypothetical protein ACFQMH_11190 [Streptomyces viridiviolaceus]|uniref:Uncharacterized protein n=1 Tax=Streptomyces viridiviolaceus TaxID=68282 RepID=A0ABW2E0B4_9ACTN